MAEAWEKAPSEWVGEGKGSQSNSFFRAVGHDLIAMLGQWVVTLDFSALYVCTDQKAGNGMLI